MGKKSPAPTKSTKKTSLPQQLIQLQEELAASKEKEKRALADYQNLVRRNQEERGKLIQLANRELLEALLQPVEHLELAVAQTQDAGVKMVLEQLKNTLAEFDLQEIEVLGKEFDVETMEAVESDGKGKKVTKVVRKGYRLHNAVIQHAKVILE